VAADLRSWATELPRCDAEAAPVAGASPVAEGPAVGPEDGPSRDDVVASLRHWLTCRQSETVRKRAALLLEAHAGVWSSRPEPRHLPSMAEWLWIGLLTRRSERTSAQEEMMRAAARHHGARLAAAAAGVVAALAAALGLSAATR
jgi:hypothetical protein